MTKFNFSKVIKISASEVKKIAVRGNQNTPYARALQLKPGEGFVDMVNSQLTYVYHINRLLSWV